MLIAFIFVLVVFGGLTAFFFAKRKVQFEGETVGIWGWGFVPLILGLIITLFMSLTNVPANSVGVVRFGGDIQGEISSGYSLKAPWKNVTDIDGTEQLEKYYDTAGDNGPEDTSTTRYSNCIDVTLGDRSKTCMAVLVRWRIVPDKADEIYKNYRDDNPVKKFRDNVLSPATIDGAVQAAQTYNPVAQLKTVSTGNLDSDFKFEIDYTALASQIKAEIEKQTSGRAEILGVSVTDLPLSKDSQDRVNKFVAGISDTLLAAQLIETNKKKAAANAALAESLAKNPAVNVANCIESVANSVPNTFPAGFQCQEDANGSVVIPSK